MLKFDEKKFLFILIFLHLAIALPLAFYLNIWVDEASTLYTTQNGFFHSFSTIVFTDEKQAPLYFLLLSLWRKIKRFDIFCAAFFDHFQSVWR